MEKQHHAPASAEQNTKQNTPIFVVLCCLLCVPRVVPLGTERGALCLFPFISPISSLMELRGEIYSVQLCNLSLKFCPLCLFGIGARHAHIFASRGCNTQSSTLV